MEYSKWLYALSEECRREFKGRRMESHDLNHSMRVWKNAEKLGKEFNADMEVLVAAVFLHDVGVAHTNDLKHGKESARIARKALERIGFPEGKISSALEAIEQHDDVKKQRKSLESKILFDCDNMDAFGAVGVFRYLDIYAKRGWGIREIAEHVCENVKERFRNLHFRQSRKICRENYEFTRKYFLKLKKELGSNYFRKKEEKREN
ncbi:HD domain-containing protein [Candidatus Micrarchaeota archaeon]|nr:HD domain-containing protein [Candidatus Micrarchaeota archaeon]